MSYPLKHKTNKKISNGKYYPLGATLKEDGVNFALYSRNAKEVYLLLFNDPRKDPSDIIQLQCNTKNIWHVFVHGLKAGQLYAYKVSGEFNPAYGFRFNEHKLLIDPYAKAFTSKLKNKDRLLLSYDPNSNLSDLSFDSRDNTRIVPKCIVIDDNHFDWQNDNHPDIPIDEFIIYEAHLKGFTEHPSSKVKHPGTYLGFVEKIPYLKDLGITAVELLPIHEFYRDEDYLIKKGLRNYWGYSTLGYFAPELSYSSRAKTGCQVNEFKTMVRELHKAGIEIILDVVFNHSCEGNELGPTISFRGIDNPTYYRLTGPDDSPGRRYTDFTGCGNSLNVENVPVLKLVMDSLRYWVKVMHVDGFRFDLASALGREHGSFLKTAAFFDAISQDPDLSRVKLIAEPWDLGTYQVGNFPVDWSEWNGKFRDTIRKFGKGDPGQLKDMGARIFGSNDIYKKDGRTAYNSINFVTCHDGFTLYDLVSYDHKHNEANLENNNDGTDDNNSLNCGIEGETKDSKIQNLRKQLMKNYICYLFLSGGTPMLCGGDEFCRTQKGNNNAYCQDNETNWFNWRYLEKNEDIHLFMKKIIKMVKRYRSYRKGRVPYGNLLPPDIKWYGRDLNYPDWENPQERLLCYEISENDTHEVTFLVIYNSDDKTQKVRLSSHEGSKKWFRVIDTSLPSPNDFIEKGRELPAYRSDYYMANSKSVVLLVKMEDSKTRSK